MVKKLFKHECVALGRILFPVYLITLGFAILTRCMQFLNSDNVAYDFLLTSSIIFLCVAVSTCLVMSLVMSIIRYHRNLFTGEGYLTFTLPATPTQHLCVKFFAAIAFQALAWITATLSLVIAASWDLLREIFLAVDYIVKQAMGSTGFHFWLYVLEAIVLLVVSSIGSLLVYYTCITIGQLAKKNRTLMAVVTYFVFYVITQILSTILSIVFALVGEPVMEWLGTVLTNSPIPTIHILFGIVIALNLLFDTILFAVCRYIICRKLNLE